MQPISIVSVLAVLAYKALTKTEEVQTKKAPLLEPDYAMDFADAFNIIFTAYGYIINLYPLYDKLDPSIRSPKALMYACTVALLTTAVVYTIFAYTAAEVFGFYNLQQNIF